MADSSKKQGKVIDTLRQRREIERQIRELLELEAEDAIQEKLEQIVTQNDFDSLLATLLGNLGTTDPRFRGALGLIASRLPSRRIVPYLRAAAKDRSRSDQERLTAVMILEKYLNRKVDEATLADLRNPDEVAMQSLREVIAESRRDRSIILDYIHDLNEQPLEVVGMILRCLREMPAESQVELLRVMAQDDRYEVASQAVDMLSRNRTPQAGRALQMLRPTIWPDLRRPIDTALRKLTLAGVPIEPLPPPDPSWRTLVSPIDSGGIQKVLFIQPYPDSKRYRFLSLAISDRYGIVEAEGGDDVADTHFPEPAPLGTVHPFALFQYGLSLLLMEADFDYGRRLVLRALQKHFEENVSIPLPYRLWNDFIWDYSAETVKTDFQLPPPRSEPDADYLARSPSLLDLPAFAMWFVQSPLIEQHAERLIPYLTPRGVDIPHGLVVELTETHFKDPDIVKRFVGRLWTMSEWLLLSGQEEAAYLAYVAGDQLHSVPPSQHPLLLGLVEAGLKFALLRRVYGIDVRFKTFLTRKPG